MQDLTVADVNAVACPECGGPVSGYETNQPMKQKFTPVEMWPGGPIWNDPGPCIQQEPDGPAITTLSPCGHRVRKINYAEAAIKQMQSARGAGGQS